MEVAFNYAEINEMQLRDLEILCRLKRVEDIGTVNDKLRFHLVRLARDLKYDGTGLISPLGKNPVAGKWFPLGESEKISLGIKIFLLEPSYNLFPIPSILIDYVHCSPTGNGKTCSREWEELLPVNATLSDLEKIISEPSYVATQYSTICFVSTETGQCIYDTRSKVRKPYPLRGF